MVRSTPLETHAGHISNGVNKMKFKFNLQLKLLLIITFLIIFVLSILSFFIIAQQREILETAFKNQAIILAQAFEAGFTSKIELSDENLIQSKIYKIIWLNPEIVKMHISIPEIEGLRIVASNEATSIGKIIDREVVQVFEKDIIVSKKTFTPEGAGILTVISPIHIGGQRAGVSEIGLTLESLEKIISQSQKQYIFITIFGVIIILFSLFLLLRIVVIKPILELQKGVGIVGAGNLDHKVKIERLDELGDLAKGFNQMTEKLKESYRTLEAKVVERTKQLAEKVKELGRFNKLAIGRELKMAELKKEIEELKKKLEEKTK